MKPIISQNHIQFESVDGLMIHFWFGQRTVQTNMNVCEKVWFELNIRLPNTCSMGVEIKTIRKIKQIINERLNQSGNLWEIGICPKCNVCHA
jgi:hypothetical protein